MTSIHNNIVFFTITLFLSCNQMEHVPAEKSDSTHVSKQQLKEGYIMPGMDHGFEQSPINIESQDSSFSNTHKITLYYNDEINKIENLGHTVQLDFTDGSTISMMIQPSHLSNVTSILLQSI